MPLVQFHDYSILVAPQTFELWFFPILVCALGFLPTTQNAWLWSSSCYKFKIKPSFSRISPWLLWSCTLNISTYRPFFFLCHETTTTLLITQWIHSSMHLQHSPPIPQAFCSIKPVLFMGEVHFANSLVLVLVQCCFLAPFTSLLPRCPLIRAPQHWQFSTLLSFSP